jgi:hypothetical protein
MKIRKDYEKLFSRLEHQEPPQSLLPSIIAAIAAKKRQAARLRLAIFGVFTLVSLVAMVPAIQYFIAEFSRSGFYNYLSLLFSDWNLALTYWNDFILSLAEALPVLALAAILGAVFGFLGSLRLAVNQIRLAFSRIN